MIPTNKLRWIKRKMGEPFIDLTKGPFGQMTDPSKMILQQWWTDTYGKGEWRDVPIEQE